MSMTHDEPVLFAPGDILCQACGMPSPNRYLWSLNHGLISGGKCQRQRLLEQQQRIRRSA